MKSLRSILSSKGLPHRALVAAFGVLAGIPAYAGDNPLDWYGSGSGGELGGDGTWSQNASVTSRWYHDESETYYTWTQARQQFGTSSENLIVANFRGTAGTVTVGNLGPNAQTFIGSVNVLTGGYTFTGTSTITLAGSDRVNLRVDTTDKTPVVFEAGVTIGLRNNIRVFEIAEGDDLTIEGVIENGRIQKTGDGVLRLTGANTIENSTTLTVSAGTLYLSNTTGSGSGNGGILVESGATLGGTGIIAPTSGRTVRIAGTLSPGENSVDTLTFDFTNESSRLVFLEGAFLEFAVGIASDLIEFGTPGDWLSGSELATLNLIVGAGFSYDESYTIFKNATTENFSFLNITGYDDETYRAVLTRVNDDYVLSFAPVPEPTVSALLVLGAVLSGWHFIRRRHRVA